MLDGKIQILHNLRFGCDYINQLIINLIGIEIVDTNPFQTIDLAKFPQQFRQ